MYKQAYQCKVSYKNEIAPGVIDMKVISEDIAQNSKPGQFLNIKCSDSLTAILRRPISICDVEIATSEIRFIFQIKGEGTKLLANKNKGEMVDILGPIGTPFSLETEYKKPLLIGGGIGVFPLLMLAKKLNQLKPSAFLGFRNKDMVVLENEFSEICADFAIATDDGSYGHKGFVTQLMEDKIAKGETDLVYACGPEPMLKIIKRICDQYEIPCQISMEQRMGCGIGACLVCACKTKSENDWEYQHVCKDGPVFWGSEVIFDD